MIRTKTSEIGSSTLPITKWTKVKNWDFRTEINKLAREIFKEEFETVDIDGNEEALYASISANFNKLNEIRQSFEKQMTEIGKKAQKIYSSKNINYQGLGQKMNWLGNLFDKKDCRTSQS